jgi:hypothetical protein
MPWDSSNSRRRLCRRTHYVALGVSANSGTSIAWTPGLLCGNGSTPDMFIEFQSNEVESSFENQDGDAPIPHGGIGDYEAGGTACISKA